MFFPLELLRHPHHMLLNVPWIAATRGINHVSKHDIAKADVAKLARHIMEFLQSDSINPRKRFSLRLSTLLVYGTVLVWRKQVDNLQAEVELIIRNGERETEKLRLRLQGQFVQTQPTPVAVEKRKKKTKKPTTEEQTPDSLVALREKAETWFDTQIDLRSLEAAYAGSHAQARIEDITLRDEQPITMQEPYKGIDDFGEGLEVPPVARAAHKETSDNIGIEIHRTEEAAVEREKITDFEPAQMPTIEVETTEKRVQEFQPREVRIEPSMQISAIPAMEVETTDDRVQEKPSEIQIEPSAQIPAVPVIEVEAVEDRVQDQQPEVQIEDSAQIILPVKKTRTLADIMYVSRRRKKFVLINKPLEIFNDEEMELEPIKLIFSKMPPTILKEEFCPKRDTEVGRPPDQTEREHRSTATTIGGSEVATSGTATPSLGATSIGAEFHSFVGPTIASTPAEVPLLEYTRTEVLAVAANGEMLYSPSKKRKVVTVKSPVPALTLKKTTRMEVDTAKSPPSIRPLEQMPMEENLEMLPPEQHLETPETLESSTSPVNYSLPQSPQFGVKWIDRIMRVLDIHPKLRPIEICSALNEKPTKLHMARIFAAVLALAKQKQVTLHSAENSLELEFVEKNVS